MLSKKSLRATIRRRLVRHSADTRRRRSRLIRKKLFALEAFRHAKVVCFYVSLPTEVDTGLMIDGALKSGKRVLAPLANLENKELELYEIKNRRTDLRRGAYGIWEPRLRRARRADPGKLDCVIVPGIAFDRQKNRLGRGGGFYDRFLKRLKLRTLKIGLAFSFQVISKVPTLKHDQTLDLVLTD